MFLELGVTWPPKPFGYPYESRAAVEELRALETCKK